MMNQQAKETVPAHKNLGVSTFKSSLLQRMCACGQHSIAGGECEACHRKRERMLQHPTVSATPLTALPTIVHEGLKSPGQPLDTETRAFMESRFEHDFSQVRVHTDERAGKSARSVHALAYTVGKDIVFGAGQYAPRTSEGRKLMAHELTHVIQQQGVSDGNSLQGKLAFDPIDDVYEQEAVLQAAKVMQGHKVDLVQRSRQSRVTRLQRQIDTKQILGSSGCSVPDSGPSGPLLAQVPFTIDSDDLSTGRSAISSFMASGSSSTLGAVRIDGYASTDGPKAHNLQLSCSRALSVKKELVTAYNFPESSIIVFAHGETSEFSNENLAANRIVIISTESGSSPSAPVPVLPEAVSPEPASQQHICGPDITSQVEDVLSQIETTFHGEKDNEKRYRACQALTDIDKWAMAWDIIELFLPNTYWLQGPPYHGPCGVPGAPPREDAANCSNSVQVGDKCYLAGTVNYGAFGIMYNLCSEDEKTNPSWQLHRGDSILPVTVSYNEAGMKFLIKAYKTVFLDDPGPPTAWAVATYNGGPKGKPSIANRQHCTGRCTVPYSGGPFDFVWEPFKPRPGGSR